VILAKKQVLKILPIRLWFLRRLFWAIDRDQLTEEVRLEKGREIREEKKEQKLAAMSSQEGDEEESKIDCFSDEADNDADDEAGGVVNVKNKLRTI
jgi:hypothetical protein